MHRTSPSRGSLVVLFAVLTILSMPTPAEAIDEIDWRSAPAPAGTVVGDDLLVQGAGTHRLAVIDAPLITGDEYAVRGTVTYEGVEGFGYFEMWSYFDGGEAYFSRTLATEGPAEALSGDARERDFELPFYLNGADTPERIELNLVLPEGGVVWVGPLTLDFGPASQWWTQRQSALIGSIGGVIAGLTGAVIGLVGGRRRARRFVETALLVGAGAGILALVTGVIALATSQPRHVWYLLFLFGGILTIVDGMLLPTMRRSYAAAELQRIRALDA